MTATQNTKLTVEAADALMLDAAGPELGAIEDCEANVKTMTYFFETGAVGRVNLTTGAVTISRRA